MELSEQNFRRRAELLCEQGHDESRQLQYMQIFKQEDLNRGVESVLEMLKRQNHRLAALESIKQMLTDGRANGKLAAADLYQANLLTEKARTNRKIKKVKRSEPGVVVAAVEQFMGSDRLLEKLEYEADRVPSDCMSLLQYESQNLHDQLDPDRVNAIRNNVRLVNWLCLDKASLLLLNGRSDISTSMDTSLVCAQIYAGLAQLSDNKTLDGSPVHVPLAYFGSQYHDTNDPNAWPVEIAMSLLCQLIEHYPNFSSTVLRDLWGSIDATSISNILICFESLLSEVPEGTYLILMLEGLEVFSNPAPREKKMRHLIKRLVEIWRRRKAATKATLKFIFVSATRGDYVEDLFSVSEDQILDLCWDLPDDMPESDGLVGQLEV